MKLLKNLLGVLGFRSQAIHSLAERQAVIGGIVWFVIGFLFYAYVRNFVYAELPELMIQKAGLLAVLSNLNIIQSILFLTFIYIPVIILGANVLSGNGIGFFMSGSEYRAHFSSLFPLWGVLSLIAAPLQWLIPHFLIIGMVEISIGIMIRSLLLVFYTLWAIRQLNYLSFVQALEVFAISWLTFPIYYLLSTHLVAVPIVLAIILLLWAGRRIQKYRITKAQAQVVSRHLQTLSENPQNADAHYQLGLIHGSQKNLEAAQDYFSRASEIAPQEPEYHYSLGRTYEWKGDWRQALQCYEEAYRLNPEYNRGVISRELGKGYLHTEQIEKGIEFLKKYLTQNSSDSEGRYWLAAALQQAGDDELLRFHLKVILEQARSSPHVVRKNNREWIYRARRLMRNLKQNPIIEDRILGDADTN
jgi:tetratricopeptide (TPR) repeat protein